MLLYMLKVLYDIDKMNNKYEITAQYPKTSAFFSGQEDLFVIILMVNKLCRTAVCGVILYTSIAY